MILKCEFCKSNVVYTKAISELCPNCGAALHFQGIYDFQKKRRERLAEAFSINQGW